MKLWKSLFGLLKVQFTSGSPEQSLDTIIQNHIAISNVVRVDELTYQMQIYRKDYRRVSGILKRRGDRLKVIEKLGQFWFFRELLHRPVLLFLSAFLLATSLFLPSRILFVAVEGNSAIPEQRILSAAETSGIRFGASRKQVRSEKVKNALLAAVPQLQWVGVNTSGCTAMISVMERAEVEEKTENGIVSNLVAQRDGYIVSATVTNGTAHFQPGEAVTEGQLLISGYTDCGICIRVSRAEGEIIAQTTRNITAVMPDTYWLKRDMGNIGYKISLLIGKKRINLWKDSRISDTGCGRMYEEYFVSLPGGFQLPAAICVERYQPWELQEASVPEDEAKRKLPRFSESYLTQQMIAGQILWAREQVFSSDGLYRLEGSYTCTEMIGKEQREQIGVINGKRN